MTDTIGTRIRQLISRSGSLNLTRSTSTRLTQNLGGLNVTRTDISFTAPDTISCAGSAFPTISVGANIEVTGSASNNRVFKVLTSAAGTITVEPSQVTTTGAGALIDIRTV